MISASAEIRGADIARHYDELDAYYRAIWGDHVHHGYWRTGDESLATARRQLVDLVAAEAGVKPGMRLCDIGCGYGATARLLAAEYDVEVTAITISPAQHEVAMRSESGTRRPTFLLGDWLNNDLPDASFDLALAMESAEHMPDKPRFFAQAHRVLRHGGTLVTTGWLARESPTPRQQRWLLEPICRGGRMPSLGSESDYRRLAAEAGFTVESFRDVTRGISRTWPKIAQVFLGYILQHPGSLRVVMDPRRSNAVFALTAIRLWIAFRTRALRYGIFVFCKTGA